jgi:hypothetical protein
MDEQAREKARQTRAKHAKLKERIEQLGRLIHFHNSQHHHHSDMADTYGRTAHLLEDELIKLQLELPSRKA